MMPGMNSRQMKQMMKQMGIQQQELDDVQRVEIITSDRKLVIEPAQVAKVNMMGQQTWQVNGEAREESLETAVEISDEDVQTVVDQTGVSAEQARTAIEAAEGDLAAAIMNLQE